MRPPASSAAAALLIDSLKGLSAAWRDPMTCNAYWIGAHPAVWGNRK